MMAKKAFNKTKEFKALNEHWANILKLDGFNDVDPGDDTVIQPQIFVAEKSQSLGGLSYYELCQQILREFRFKKEIHRIIFSLHSEGLSVREISKHLKEHQSYKITQMGIHKIIHRTKEAFLRGE